MAIVTLTTDFGTVDGYVGAVKGAILSRAPGAQLVDITHDIPQFDIAAGAYCLRQMAPYFPEGTIHVAIVDPGVGTGRNAIIVDDGRCLFIGPDNGLFALAAPKPRAVYAIESPQFMRGEVAPTFHGRDIFGPTAGVLAAGGRPQDAGPRVALTPLAVPKGVFEHDDKTSATIIHVDAFGNLITDRPGVEVPPGARIEVGGWVIPRLSRTFGEVPRGEVLAYVDSSGFVAIGVREGSAHDRLGVAIGDPVLFHT